MNAIYEQLIKPFTPLFYYSSIEKYSRYRLHWIVFYTLMIVVNLLVYQYLLEQEEKQCKCSQQYRSSFKNVILIKVCFMVLELVSLFVTSTGDQTNTMNFIASNISFLLHLPVSLLFMWNISSFDLDCECTEDWKKYMIYFCFF